MNTILHHAVLIEGEGNKALEMAKNHAVHVIGIDSKANPDLQIIYAEQYTIDDARELKQKASQIPIGHSQVFIIMAEGILHAAQNALLKLLEEPSENTYFVIIVPEKNKLLPTVRSRLTFAGSIDNETNDNDIANSFLQASIHKRLQIVRPIIENKNRAEARRLLSALEEELHADVQKNASQLKEIAFIRQYITDNSSSLKMLLEHLVSTI